MKRNFEEADPRGKVRALQKLGEQEVYSTSYARRKADITNEWRKTVN